MCCFKAPAWALFLLSVSVFHGDGVEAYREMMFISYGRFSRRQVVFLPDAAMLFTGRFVPAPRSA